MSALHESVTARYGSIHAFCRTHPELTRSTVYQVLGGRYPGNVARQAALIRAVLEDADTESPGLPDTDELTQVILAARCGRCRRPDRRGCRGCRIQAGREAQAVQDFLAQQRS